MDFAGKNVEINAIAGGKCAESLRQAANRKQRRWRYFFAMRHSTPLLRLGWDEHPQQGDETDT
ncbi:hypothetical protein RvVAT039_32230 [Agrobacterium vitis]|nr:hypothetical protein RvVAR0630_22530 [Agrobacterium vitis]BCH66007.1 hypothetical protein RvVAT039_32230 [Agrobacterium vitis]